MFYYTKYEYRQRVKAQSIHPIPTAILIDKSPIKKQIKAVNKVGNNIYISPFNYSNLFLDLPSIFRKQKLTGKIINNI